MSSKGIGSAQPRNGPQKHKLPSIERVGNDYNASTMCGRTYKTYTEEELYFQYLSKRPLNFVEFSPVYNLCPTQNLAVLRLADGERRFEEMRWQLVPDWEPAFTTKLSTINAKSETVFDSSLFGPLVVRQRCIVPISGFFEWKADGQRKRPFKIHLAESNVVDAGIVNLELIRTVRWTRGQQHNLC